jgi:hypothetical protein
MKHSPFEERFRKSGGKPIIYKGEELVMIDRFPVPKRPTRMECRFVSTSSRWRQGMNLSTKGKIHIANQTISQPIALWEDTAPRSEVIVCDSKNGILEVYNLWDTGDGVTEAWHNGAAMIVEEIPGGRRYRCNDGYPDEDFDDIVFELVILE